MNHELFLKDEVFAVVGAGMEVYNELGCGFLEPVYQEALAIEMRDRGIPFKAQCPLQIRYKGTILDKTYCADFICYEQLVVELKAMEKIFGRDEAQILNYLKATGKAICLLLNFGKSRIEIKRYRGFQQ